MKTNAEANSTLRGQIELKDVVYRYSSSDPIVLHGMSLRIEAGEHVAITGPSGGGKSTLVNIMLGLAEPNSGELLVDGLPLKQFGYKNYHDQVSAVLQDDVLFAGSLADNIALFDDSPDIGAVEEASRMAAIHKDIMQMPMQYETLIGDMGSTLSGGQKQRVLLARALYRRPRILIMDEGTAHLDSEHEKSVNDAISRKKITRIIIAHRKETIESADRILVIRDGQIFN
jgi:ATP-binding cassette subfamily B protein RaxB